MHQCRQSGNSYFCCDMLTIAGDTYDAEVIFLQGNIWMMILNVAVRMGNKGGGQPKIFPKGSL